MTCADKMPVTPNQNIICRQPILHQLPRSDANNVDQPAAYHRTSNNCDDISGPSFAFPAEVKDFAATGSREWASKDDGKMSNKAIKEKYFRSGFSIDSLLCKDTDRRHLVTSLTEANRQTAGTGRNTAVDGSSNHSVMQQSGGSWSLSEQYQKLQPTVFVLTGNRSTQLNFGSQSFMDLRPSQAPIYQQSAPTQASTVSPRLRLFPLQKCRLKRHRADRKPRQPFSSTQLAALESAFDRCQYLTVSERVDVASSLGLDDRRVKIWFQNRRAKCRRIAEARLDERNRARLIEATLSAVAKDSQGNFQLSAFAPAADDKPQNARMQQQTTLSRLPSVGLLLETDRAVNAVVECRNQAVASNVLPDFVNSSAWTEIFRRVAAEMSAEHLLSADKGLSNQSGLFEYTAKRDSGN